MYPEEALSDPPICLSSTFEIDVATAKIGDIVGKLVAIDEDSVDVQNFFMVRGTEFLK